VKTQSVQRTAERRTALQLFSVVRFTDSVAKSHRFPSDKSLGYVRLKARVVGEVKVLFRYTLSGL